MFHNSFVIVNGKKSSNLDKNLFALRKKQSEIFTGEFGPSTPMNIKNFGGGGIDSYSLYCGTKGRGKIY